MKKFLLLTILFILQQQIQSTPYYYRIGRDVIAVVPETDAIATSDIVQDVIVSELRKEEQQHAVAIESQPIIEEIKKDEIIVPIEQLRLVQPIIEIEEPSPAKIDHVEDNVKKIDENSISSVKKLPIDDAIRQNVANDDADNEVAEAPAPVAPANPPNFFQQTFQNFITPFSNVINSLRPNVTTSNDNPNLFQQLQQNIQDQISNFQVQVNSILSQNAQQSVVEGDDNKPATQPNIIQTAWMNIQNAQSSLNSNIQTTFQSLFNRPQDEPKVPNKPGKPAASKPVEKPVKEETEEEAPAAAVEESVKSVHEEKKVDKLI